MRLTGMMKGAALLALLGTAAFAANTLTERERSARFAYDLGDETIDVSTYPKEQQENYALFAAKCAQCHTLARPINSPMATRAQWQRFVRRMHAKIKASGKSPVTDSDFKRIVDFLVFDGKTRKLGPEKKAFDSKVAQLRLDFARVKKERDELEQEEARAKSKAYGDDTMPAPKPSATKDEN